jgi:hypothetical protein
VYQTFLDAQVKTGGRQEDLDDAWFWRFLECNFNKSFSLNGKHHVTVYLKYLFLLVCLVIFFVHLKDIEETDKDV